MFALSSASVVVESLRVVRVEDFVTDDMPDFGRFHAPMNAGRDDQLDVVYAVVGEQREHDCQHALTRIGALHRR